MLATMRKKSQITIPSEIVDKLGLEEGAQFEVVEKDGTIIFLPLAVYPVSYIEALKSEVNELKSMVAEGKQPIFDNVDELFKSLEK